MVRHGDGTTRQAAAEQLQAIVDKLEAFADDPGEQWRTLSDIQRWGYLRLLSHLGTATHELQQWSSPGSVAGDVVATKTTEQQ